MRNGEATFLTAFFAALNERGVRYAVLRNAETLPQSLKDGDVDILTTANGIAEIASILELVAAACGGRVMARMRAPHFVQTELMGCVKGSWWGCCLDLFDGVYVQSVLPIVGEGVLDCRVDNGQGVWTLPHDVGHYLGFVKELLVAGKRSVRYEVGAKRAVAANLDGFVLSERCRTFIRKALAEGHATARAFVNAWKLDLALRHPIYFWRNSLGFSLSRLVRYFRPCGKMIAVMGTDGAGKTTVLEAILPVIRAMNHNGTVVHHLKPDLLPPLGRFRGVKSEPGRVCATPHASRPSDFAFSLVRVAYLLLDYVLGYWLKVRVRIAKTPIAYWILDRYADDLLIDPRRFRVKLPQGVLKALLFLVPRPDLILCLGGEPEKIYARKPETSLEEVRRQVAALRRFCDDNPRAVWIDTTGPVEASANAALTAILSRLQKRGSGR